MPIDRRPQTTPSFSLSRKLSYPNSDPMVVQLQMRAALPHWSVSEADNCAAVNLRIKSHPGLGWAGQALLTG